MRIHKGREVELERHVIAASVTMKLGDIVMVINNGVDISDAVSDRVYGLCEGIVTKDGVPLNQALSDDFDGTFTASTQTYAAAADNYTDKKVSALIRPIRPGDVLSALLDDTINTTTGSGKPGYFIDVLTTDAAKLDESNTHTSNILQFVLMDNGQGTGSAVDPVRGGNNVLVSLAEAQIPRGVQG